MNQTDKIYRLLKRRGERGVSNRELNKIAFRYSARIADLRHDGYQISTLCVKPGLYRFTLHED